MGMQNPLYMHVGIGAPNVRSHEIFYTDIPTSTALKKQQYSDYLTRPALFYTFIPKIVDKFRQYAVRRYRSWDRNYYVFPCGNGNDFCELLKTAINIYDWIIDYERYRDAEKVMEMFNDALTANSVNEMLSKLRNIENEIPTIQIKINEKIYARREALFNRFRRNHEKNKHILEKYFPELLPPRMYAYTHSFMPIAEIADYIQHLGFDEQRASQYAWFLYDHHALIVIPRTSNTIEILINTSVSEKLRIYADSCEENEKFVACKLIATQDDKRVLFIAVIGYDKLTNQRFIHYVSPTLLLRDVETCRRWVLGLTDRYGKPIYNAELIET